MVGNMNLLPQGQIDQVARKIEDTVNIKYFWNVFELCIGLYLGH